MGRHALELQGHKKKNVNMTTLVNIPAGHMCFVPAHKQAGETTAILSPAKWLVEFVLIANPKGREAFMDHDRIHTILALTIQATYHLAPEATYFFPPHSFLPNTADARTSEIPMRPLPTSPATPAIDTPRELPTPP